MVGGQTRRRDGGMEGKKTTGRRDGGSTGRRDGGSTGQKRVGREGNEENGGSEGGGGTEDRRGEKRKRRTAGREENEENAGSEGSGGTEERRERRGKRRVGVLPCPPRHARARRDKDTTRRRPPDLQTPSWRTVLRRGRRDGGHEGAVGRRHGGGRDGGTRITAVRAAGQENEDNGGPGGPAVLLVLFVSLMHAFTTGRREDNEERRGRWPRRAHEQRAGGAGEPAGRRTGDPHIALEARRLWRARRDG